MPHRSAGGSPGAWFAQAGSGSSWWLWGGGQVLTPHLLLCSWREACLASPGPSSSWLSWLGISSSPLPPPDQTLPPQGWGCLNWHGPGGMCGGSQDPPGREDKLPLAGVAVRPWTASPACSPGPCPPASPWAIVGAEGAHPTPPPVQPLPRTHRQALFRGPGRTTECLLWLASGDAIGGLGWVGRGCGGGPEVGLCVCTWPGGGGC